MRRRSERKKSTDVASPAPPPVSRRTSSRRSRVSSDNEKHSEQEQIEDIKESKRNEVPPQHNDDEDNVVRERERDSSGGEEPSTDEPARRSRSSRKRTPLADRQTPTKKRRDQREKSVENKVDTIPEETENGDNVESETNKGRCDDGNKEGKDAETEGVDVNQETLVEEAKIIGKTDDNEDEPNTEVKVVSSTTFSSKANKEEDLKTTDVLDIQTEEVERDNNSESPKEENQQKQNASAEEGGNIDQDLGDEASKQLPKEDIRELKDNTVLLEKSKHKKNDSEPQSGVDDQKENVSAHDCSEKGRSISVVEKESAGSKPAESIKPSMSNSEQNGNTNEIKRAARKRKWLSKKVTERNSTPILAISTDSLKNIIADVQPVPLSDVQLESSSEEEGVISDREDGERSSSPEQLQHEASDERIEKVEKVVAKRKESLSEVDVAKTEKSTHHSIQAVAAASKNAAAAIKNAAAANKNAVVAATPLQHSPSPPRNRSSHVLYITNLVRPFTVLQLKGLLARTGKIVEDGFWIDRIKSKCYVEYETEDEAIETRHALHGVRWPVSNPKFLNVDFGSKADIERAKQSTQEDGAKFGQENSRDNQHTAGGGIWGVTARNELEEKKNVRPVREWDVGKKESLDREKPKADKRHSSRERDSSRHRDHERSDKDRKLRQRSRDRDHRSRSASPVRKLKKKENDPPIRLLDDLFRKTKAAPCIYWLPLTPEQIAEKEAFRQKRIEEHKQRVKARELERKKESEKERQRERERDRERDRDRDSRRNRSSERDRDRRRSRSRDRRRY